MPVPRIDYYIALKNIEAVLRKPAAKVPTK